MTLAEKQVRVRRWLPGGPPHARRVPLRAPLVVRQRGAAPEGIAAHASAPPVRECKALGREPLDELVGNVSQRDGHFMKRRYIDEAFYGEERRKKDSVTIYAGRFMCNFQRLASAGVEVEQCKFPYVCLGSQM